MKQKKFLGQNFLNNKNILGAMARAAEITKCDVVLEAGPGRGSLTEVLAGHAKKVIAVTLKLWRGIFLIPHLR